jgi:hypothetical protein
MGDMADWQIDQFEIPAEDEPTATNQTRLLWYHGIKRVGESDDPTSTTEE